MALTPCSFFSVSAICLERAWTCRSELPEQMRK